MELFLNFLWLTLSIVLVVHWARVAKPTCASQVGKAAVAMILLIVVLLPVISATDDLAAMTGVLESEHAEHIVRRGEMPLLDIQHDTAVPLLPLLFTLFSLFVDLAFLSALRSRVVSQSKAQRLMDGFRRAAGIRPPPVQLLVAA
ncbi:MAG: hypothetical protein PW789_06635 [Edaphobacter sp.]|uniref:hypothetical protein n=1 Tax=Edaphobacter sp. TaxID=1934404 RepID=UPI00239EEACF|nr:hypothetical protein [Edaphobacter sp.]MDE1176272.1 hypothetical protein [Edaphobacter sp.]